MKNPKTLKELREDSRVDQVNVERMGWEGTRWFIYLASGYVASDMTSTIVGTRAEVLKSMTGVIEGEPE